MYPDNTPLIDINGKWKHIHSTPVASPVYEVVKSLFRFLYIGSNPDMITTLEKCFYAGKTVDSFILAKRTISKYFIEEGILPDTIFIDIPLSKADLYEFCNFLKNQSFLSRTLIIYNEKHLVEQNLSALKQLNFVDDIIDFSSAKINYVNKTTFLKKVKLQDKLNKSATTKPAKEFTTLVTASVSIKRVVDILVASLIILLLTPLFLLIAIAVGLETKGPIIYTSLRAGRGFRVFKFYKFRTMEANADKKVEALAHLNQYGANDNGPKFFKVSNDPRITKVGRFLRNTSLDELPQLINVLKGDMSLVGNRPLPLYEASTLTTNDFVERFMAPAGITGLWQIKKRGKADMSTEERINLDIDYARKCNIFYDLRIMACTPKALFQKSDV